MVQSENHHIFGIVCEFQKLKLWSHWTILIPNQAPHFLKTGKFLGTKSQNIQYYIPKMIHFNPKTLQRVRHCRHCRHCHHINFTQIQKKMRIQKLNFGPPNPKNTPKWPSWIPNSLVLKTKMDANWSEKWIKSSRSNPKNNAFMSPEFGIFDFSWVIW